jgi:predicted ATP-grasp superfamily ATP-dependent carboligase
MESKAAPTAEAPVPAVVVRGEVNGLGVVRSLAKAGVPAIVADTTLRHAAMWSRWSKRHRVDQLSGKPFVDALLRLQQKLGARPVLILTDEMSVHTVSEYRTELSPHYRIRLPSPAVVSTLCNKVAFQNFAQTHALPVPRAIVVEREADIADIAGLGLPVIVKPADKRPVHLGQVERINWLNTAEEAAAVCRRMLGAAGTLIVQEWIDGPDSSIYFALFHCGAAPPSRSIFFGRKIAAHPPGLGSTAVCVPAPEAIDLLRPLTEKLLDLSHYEGLGSLEFKWDAQARRFVIIEPTVGRTDWQEEIATLNGLNLPLIAYRYELGLPAPPQLAVSAVAWRESFVHLGRGAGLGLRAYDGYWRFDDPLPALAFGVDLAWRNARRVLSRPLFERRKPPFRRRRIA